MSEHALDRLSDKQRKTVVEKMVGRISIDPSIDLSRENCFDESHISEKEIKEMEIEAEKTRAKRVKLLLEKVKYMEIRK